MDNQPNIQSQPEQSVSNTAQKPVKSRTLVYLLIIFIAAAVAFAAAFFWQKSKNDNTVAKLNDTTIKVSQLEQQLLEKSETQDNTTQEKVVPSSATNPDLIPGDTDTRRDDGRILITAIYKYSLEPTAVWVEYGTDPSNLDKSTTKLTQGLAEGHPNDVYSQGFSVSISDSELEPGSIYYYRIAATINDQTERSAVASFVTDK